MTHVKSSFWQKHFYLTYTLILPGKTPVKGKPETFTGNPDTRNNSPETYVDITEGY